MARSARLAVQHVGAKALQPQGHFSLAQTLGRVDRLFSQEFLGFALMPWD